MLLPVPEEAKDDDSQKHADTRSRSSVLSSLSPADWDEVDEPGDNDMSDDCGGCDDVDANDDARDAAGKNQTQTDSQSSALHDGFKSGFSFLMPLLTQAPYPTHTLTRNSKAP